MKTCTKCGAQMADEAVVCPNCGCGAAPAVQLSTNRSLLKYILLGIITLGIYDIVVMSKVSTDINLIATKYDGKKTMHFCLVFFLFSWLTLGIVPLVWHHKMSARVGTELARRGIELQLRRKHLLAVGHPRLDDRRRPVYLHLQAAQEHEPARSRLQRKGLKLAENDDNLTKSKKTRGSKDPRVFSIPLQSRLLLQSR